MEEATINNMALLRVISGLLEILVAVAFLKFGKIETALRLNSFLGLIGPLVFILVSVLGITVMAFRLSWIKMICLILGSILVLLGTLNK